MSATVVDIDVLQNYIQGVMQRADHHANNVNEVILAIAGGIIWRKDPEPIRVMTRSGSMTNVLWVKISGQRMPFATTT